MRRTGRSRDPFRHRREHHAGIIQEVKADHAISALTKLTTPDARIIRADALKEIPAADVITGDLLVLAKGDIVPADAQVIEAAALPDRRD